MIGRDNKKVQRQNEMQCEQKKNARQGVTVAEP